MQRMILLYQNYGPKLRTKSLDQTFWRISEFKISKSKKIWVIRIIVRINVRFPERVLERLSNLIKSQAGKCGSRCRCSEGVSEKVVSLGSFIWVASLRSRQDKLRQSINCLLAYCVFCEIVIFVNNMFFVEQDNKKTISSTLIQN